MDSENFIDDLPRDLKLVIASQDYQIFKVINDMFEDVNKYYKEYPRVLAIQKDKFTTKKETLDYNGNIVGVEYRLDGNLHREFELPAIVLLAPKTKMWFKDGKLHRESGPAWIKADGTQEWWKNGQLHRDGDLPAIIGPRGYKAWYFDGELHREGDNPALIRIDGTQIWYSHGIGKRSLDPPPDSLFYLQESSESESDSDSDDS